MSKQVFRPLGTNIFVRLEDPPKETPGGIALPDTADESNDIGLLATVVALGPNVIEEEDADEEWKTPDIGVGDIILVDAYGGTEVPGFEKHLVVDLMSVLGVIYEDDEDD